MDAHFDELLERSGWVRQLARRLAADAHQADDLVQDAWVAALTRPPVRNLSMRGWVARVMRNRAVEVRRAAGNRSERERGAGPRGPEPATDELVERLDMQREIADAVRELDEPYRSTILLRYFEGRTPKEIAKRTGEPVRTVHSRLNRGLGLLRQRLEPRDERARGVWLAGLTALGDAGRDGAVSIGALVMGLKIKAVAAVVVAAGAVAVWQADWSEAEVQSVAPNDVAAEAVAPREEIVGQRTELEAEAEVAEELEESPEFFVQVEGDLAFGEPAPWPARRGRVIGLDGAGLAGVPVVFANFGQAGEGDPMISEPGGWFEIEGPARSGQIDAVGTDWATVFQPRVLDGQTDPPMLVVAPAIAIDGFVRDEFGNPVADVWVELEIPDHFRAGLDAIVDESHTREWRAQSDEGGRFDLEVVPGVAGATMKARHPLHVEAHWEAPVEDAFELEVVLSSSPDKVGALTGVVVDGAGMPIPDAAVVLGDSTAYADSDGQFALHVKRRDDARTLRICASGRLPVTLEGQAGVDIEFAFPDPLVIVLDQSSSELRGRVVDAAGNPVAGIAVWTPDEEAFGQFRYDPANPDSWSFDRTVESVARDDLWGEEVQTDAEGRFVLQGLQPHPYSVVAFDHARFVFGSSAPTMPGDEAEVQLEEAAPTVEVTGRITSLTGAPLEDVELSFACWIAYSSRDGAVDDERRGFHARTDADGRFSVAGVPANTETLYIGGGGLISGFDRKIDLSQTHHYEYALPLLCRMQVILPDDLSATHLNVLDADDEALAVRQKHGWVEYARERVDLEDGRSEVLRTSEKAQTLVIFNGEEEVLRMPITLDPKELTVVRP